MSDFTLNKIEKIINRHTSMRMRNCAFYEEKMTERANCRDFVGMKEYLLKKEAEEKIINLLEDILKEVKE